MEFISDLNGYAEIDGTASLAADLAGKTYVNAAAPRDDELDVMAEIDGTAGEAAVPRNGVVQTAGFEIYIDGILFGRHLQGETISVRRSYDERLQSYDFEVHLTTPTGPLGSPFGCNIPPTRQKRIDVYGVYLTSTGVHRVPLITGGIAHATSRRGTDGGYFETYSGVDRGGRFDQKLVDAVFPPGHGLTRDVVLQKCATAAGETQFRLETGKRMLKEFQLADASFIEPCSEVLDIENRRIIWNDRGELTNPQIGRRRSNEAVRWQFDERDMMLAEAVTADFKADVITEVVANGIEQLSTEQCGDITITTTLETKDLDSPKKMAYSQSGGMTFASVAGYPTEDWTTPKTVEIQVITRVERCDIEIYRRIETYYFFNPEVARYQWDKVNDEWDHVSEGSFSPYSVYVSDNAADDNPAFAFDQERWGLASVEEFWTFYNQVGYRKLEIPVPGSIKADDTWPYDTDFESAWLSYPRQNSGSGILSSSLDPDTGRVVGPLAGVKLGTLYRKHEFYLWRAALKYRDLSSLPLTPFDALEVGDGFNPADIQYVTGDKYGVNMSPSEARYFTSACDHNESRLSLIEEVVESFVTDDEGFLLQTDRYESGIGARRGGGDAAYWFGADYVAADSEESFRPLRSSMERFEGVGKTNHNIYRSAWDYLEGKPARATSEFNVDGYLPAAEFLPEAEVDTTLYDSEEEQLAIAAATMRTSTREMEVTVRADDLENCGHEYSKYVIELPWAENEEELNFGANAIIDESAAADVNLTLAGANFFVRECDLILAQYRPIDLNDVIRCKSVEWSGGGRSPILTSIQGKLYHG